MALPSPVIFVPGITASYLHDEYPVTPEPVWQIIKKNFERVTLHPDDLRYEAKEPARVVSSQINTIAYEDLIEELRYNLSPKSKTPVPVYPFSYDWRQPLERSEVELQSFIEEVIDRTKLLPHYHKQKYGDNPKVSLVAHSMGGLLVTGYLERMNGNAPVDKVVTLATPFQGAPEAILQLLTGTTSLFEGSKSSREREAARLTPALYQLFPSFNDAVYEDDATSHSIFEIQTWQRSVVDSIKVFIQDHGLVRAGAQQQAERLFAALLNHALAHRRRIDQFSLADAGLNNKDWLAVVGIDADTRYRLRVTFSQSQAKFVLASGDRDNHWHPDTPHDERTGDGTVPFLGAVPKFLGREELVCVREDDFGYWELKDKVLTKVGGFHGIMPNMNMLQRLIVRFLSGKTDKYKNTWGWPAPGVAQWDAPLPLQNRCKDKYQ